MFDIHFLGYRHRTNFIVCSDSNLPNNNYPLVGFSTYTRVCLIYIEIYNFTFVVFTQPLEATDATYTAQLILSNMVV